jgi:hypothetical protein
LTRLSREAIQEGRGPKVEMTLPKKSVARRPRKSLPTPGGSKQSTLITNNPDWPPKRKKSRLDASLDIQAGKPPEWETDLFDDDLNFDDMIDDRPTEVISLDDNSESELLLTDLFSRSNGNRTTKHEETILAEDSLSDVDAEFTFTLDGRPLRRDIANPLRKSVEVIDIPSSPES